MYMQIVPPVQIPQYPEAHAPQPVLSAVLCNTAAELIKYLQTLPPDEYLDVWGAEEGMGVVVRKYRNEDNGIEYYLLAGTEEAEHRQVYPQAWLDE